VQEGRVVSKRHLLFIHAHHFLVDLFGELALLFLQFGQFFLSLSWISRSKVVIGVSFSKEPDEFKRGGKKKKKK
jgi:hypothetical protein